MIRHKTQYLSLCFLMFTSIFSNSCFANTLFVDAHWLATHQKSVIILDARPYRNYFWSHIPGALSAPWQNFTQRETNMSAPGWGVLLPEELLAEQITALGIKKKSTVVVYADYPGWGDDGRVAWTLRMAGLEDIYLLDGGIDAWQSVGGKVTMKGSDAEKSEFVLSWNEDLVINTKEIVAAKDLVLIDTRSLEEFEGAIKFGEARGGHLPAAIHLPFTDLFSEDGHIKDKDDLEDLLTGHGLHKTDKIVTYCTAGIRSAYMTLVLRSLGYNNTKNYDESFFDWARNPDLPLN